jgi:hypothetical protein
MAADQGLGLTAAVDRVPDKTSLTQNSEPIAEKQLGSLRIFN